MKLERTNPDELLWRDRQHMHLQVSFHPFEWLVYTQKLFRTRIVRLGPIMVLLGW